MARYDLDEMRLEIAALADELGTPLTESEFNSMRYWGEGQLNAELSSYVGALQAEVEFAEESGEDFDDYVDYDYGYWEIELVWDIDT